MSFKISNVIIFLKKVCSIRSVLSLKLLLSFSLQTVLCRDWLHLGSQTQIDTNHLSKHLCRSNVPMLAPVDHISCQGKTMLAAVKLLINFSKNRAKFLFFSPTHFHNIVFFVQFSDLIHEL